MVNYSYLAKTKDLEAYLSQLDVDKAKKSSIEGCSYGNHNEDVKKGPQNWTRDWLFAASTQAEANDHHLVNTERLNNGYNETS